MRKFLLTTVVFAIPLLGLLIWMLSNEPSPSYRYQMVQKDCRSGMWIYRRLYESNDPIDVAFIGTSKTMCDVDDQLLESVLRAKGYAVKIANLGVCRVGENLHALIAQELFRHKRPKYVIYELSANLPTNSHFHFPYMATASEVLSAPLLNNGDYPEDVLSLVWTRLVYHRDQVLGIHRSFPEILEDSLHSFMYVEHDGLADSTQMSRIKEKRKTTLAAKTYSGLGAWFHDFESAYPKSYIEQVHALCQANGAQLIFMYLPSYGSPTSEPLESSYYKGLGPIWCPPDSVFGNPTLHFDDSHLNQSGARKLNAWLVQQMEKLGLE